MKERPTLRTRRLVLRFRSRTLRVVHRLAGDRDIATTTLNIPYPYEDGMAEAWIAGHQQQFEKGEQAVFAITITSSEELVGAIGLRIRAEHRRAELGYWIGKPYWNHGYCPEAAAAVVRWGFDDLGLERIHATHFVSNPASGRVMRKLAPVFVRQGYVFFIPHRRGQGRSPGPYIQDQIEQARSRADRSRLLVELHELQLNDQIAALAFLKNQSYVDSGRLAVAGCSYGGIQTVLAAERETGYRAAIDFAGGAESWRASPDLQRRMVRAVHRATVPIFFIQAENDHDLAPSRVLAAEMQRAGKPHQLRTYPRFGSTADEAHAFCVRGADLWAADVFSYLTANLK